jgi:hypothetical protein
VSPPPEQCGNLEAPGSVPIEDPRPDSPPGAWTDACDPVHTGPEALHHMETT